jgi:hypothetical protein
VQAFRVGEAILRIIGRPVELAVAVTASLLHASQ